MYKSVALSYFLLSAITVIRGLPYKDYSIRRCEEAVLLDCPTTAAASAGRISFFPPVPIRNNSQAKSTTPPYNQYWDSDGNTCEQSRPCTLTVKTREECANPGSVHAIYFNVRSFELPRSSLLEIYDAAGIGEAVLRRSWNGDTGYQYHNPESIAQVRSEYARQPAFSIEYLHKRAMCRSVRKVVFDFIIVEAERTVNNSYCTALAGYVNSEYICDTTEDRVNCPDRLWDSTTNMEAAYRRQYCLPSYWVIGGIAAASAVGLVMLIAMATLCRRRCRTCVCRPRKVCNWSSQRNCSFWSPYCSCAIKYDIQCDTGSDQSLLGKKSDSYED